MNKDKLKGILKQLDTFEDQLPKSETASLVEKILNDKYKDVTSQVKQDSSLQFLDAINSKVDKFKKTFNLRPIIEEIEGIQDSMAQMQEGINAQFSQSSEASNLTRTELESLIKNTKDDLEGMTGKEIKALLTKIESLDSQLSVQDSTSKYQGQTLEKIVSDFDSRLNKIGSQITDSEKSTTDRSLVVDNKFTESTKLSTSIKEELDKLRIDVMSRLANLGGGNANRNIAVGGNTSVLSRYTDVNIKPGSNVTLSYANNDVTKYLDLTITSSGGGGSVGGVVRSINRETTSQTMGADAGTDYVYVAGAGIALTLPTAVGNTNLYTIKNVATSSVLIATTGGETIDGDTTLILANQFTAVDLVNDGNDDWSIT